MKSKLLTLIALVTIGCDTMIADRIVIRMPANALGVQASPEQVAAIVRATLSSSWLERMQDFDGGEEWSWRDSAKPPGLHARVSVGQNGVRVRLSQDLYGPIGPTEKYRSVRSALLEAARRRFGDSSVQLN